MFVYGTNSRGDSSVMSIYYPKSSISLIVDHTSKKERERICVCMGSGKTLYGSFVTFLYLSTPFFFSGLFSSHILSVRAKRTPNFPVSRYYSRGGEEEPLGAYTLHTHYW